MHLKTENGYGFQASCGTPLSLGDKISFSENGNYCNGGGYATRGSGTVIGCGPAYLRVQCDDYAHRSVSNLGNTNIESAGVESLWFQGEYNAANRCKGYAGTLRLIEPASAPTKSRKMNTYRITFNDRDNGTLRAKNAENALRNFLRILSATHALRRGTIASVARHNADPVESASVFMWTDFHGQPVWATATRV